MTLSQLTKAAELVLNEPVPLFTTTEVTLKFPCTINPGDVVMVNTMRTTHSKVIPFQVTSDSTIAFAITMPSNDRIVGTRHVPKAVYKRHAVQLARVTKYIRKRQRTAALLHEHQSNRRGRLV
eukprot:6993812-Prymnesium_polylepis.1